MGDPVRNRNRSTGGGGGRNPVSARAEAYGARLKAEALRQGYVGRDLADLVGVSESAVSRWFSGEREIAERHRMELARVLDVPLLALFPPMAPTGERVA
jgi:transcriptional regulator with XRE-family HTH domain